MIDPLAPLLVFTDNLSNSDPELVQREIELNFSINCAVDRLLSGTIEPGEMLALLEVHGINSENYVNRVEHNINKAINQRMEFDPNEVKIYLP